MKEFLYLEDQEILLLDGKCREEIQKKVDDVKRVVEARSKVTGLNQEQAELVANAVLEAEKSGKLIYHHRSLRSCDVCKKSGGYATYTRNSRYHRKGEKNHDRPLSFSGIELADRTIRMEGRAAVGCCNSCFNAVKPALLEALASVRAEMPEQLTGKPPKWKRHDKRKCKECGWEGHEGEMGLLPAMMQGSYPGKCPKCEAKSLPFGPRVFEFVDGFELVSRVKE